ncbi:MAG: hypothetical protein KBC64_07065 [Simkaniaceae bacterium]|nr:hypothetical protein [Simkaniaceae bacterium]
MNVIQFLSQVAWVQTPSQERDNCYYIQSNIAQLEGAGDVFLVNVVIAETLAGLMGVAYQSHFPAAAHSDGRRNLKESVRDPKGWKVVVVSDPVVTKMAVELLKLDVYFPGKSKKELSDEQMTAIERVLGKVLSLKKRKITILQKVIPITLDS